MGRQEGARSTRGVFAGDSFQPWLSQSRRGLAGSVEGHVVGEGGGFQEVLVSVHWH